MSLLGDRLRPSNSEKGSQELQVKLGLEQKEAAFRTLSRLHRDIGMSYQGSNPGSALRQQQLQVVLINGS